MSNAINLAKASSKGGFHLFWGVALSSIISSISVMVVAGILQEGEYGLVGIALLAPNLIQIIRDMGIDQATIKYTAQYKHQNNPEKLKNILTVTITFEFLMGILLTIISYFLSGYIATHILNRPDITSLVQIASLSIFGTALFKASESAFVGYEKMHYQSISLIIQSSIKAILMISLVLSNFGVFGALLGHSLSYLIVGFVATALLYFKIYKKINLQNTKLQLLSTLKQMFQYGLPISASMIFGSFATQIYSFLIAIYLSNQTVGNYNLALNFTVIVAFFVTPVQTLLFPAFSKIDSKKEPQTLQSAFQSSVKYASLLVVPAAFMVMSLSQPAIATLFPGKYQQSPIYLSFYLILYIYTAFGNLSNPNLLKSQGETKLHLKLSIINAILGLVLAFILIPIFGVMGLISTILISALPYLIISTWWIKKAYNATINYKSSVKIIASSSFCAVLTYAAISFLQLPDFILLALGAIIYFISYIIITPLIGAITKTDTLTLKELIKSLGPLAKILNIPLNIIEKIAKK
ncbi:MAG: flippase [archaeon]